MDAEEKLSLPEFYVGGTQFQIISAPAKDTGLPKLSTLFGVPTTITYTLGTPKMTQQLDALLAAVIAAVWDGNVSRTARFYVDSAPGSQGLALRSF